MRHASALTAVVLLGGCTPAWSVVDDLPDAGSLSGIWGSGPDDIFAVGGTDTQGTVLHFDGTAWSAMTVPSDDPLVWVHGLSSSDVYAVGERGSLVHFDGARWTVVDSGTDQDLWGVHAVSHDDVWLVGGSTFNEGEPVLHHLHQGVVEPVAVDAALNPKGARALFKVWGMGDRLFAVGSNGWIVGFDGTRWSPMPSPTEHDLIAVWGRSATEAYAVGGRSTGKLLTLTGDRWVDTTPRRATGDVPGLNAVFAPQDGPVVVGGRQGWMGMSEGGPTWQREGFYSRFIVHGLWGDNTGTVWAVAGTFTAPHQGEILVFQ